MKFFKIVSVLWIKRFIFVTISWLVIALLLLNQSCKCSHNFSSFRDRDQRDEGGKKPFDRTVTLLPNAILISSPMNTTTTSLLSNQIKFLTYKLQFSQSVPNFCNLTQNRQIGDSGINGVLIHQQKSSISELHSLSNNSSTSLKIIWKKFHFIKNDEIRNISLWVLH